VCGLRPRDRVTEALFNLHWLPVPGRIEFKLCVLVYKSFNGIAPSYINDMLQSVTTLQRHVTLRSDTNTYLVVPRARLRFDERAFSVAAPRLWNSLPVDTRNAATHSRRSWRLLCFINILLLVIIIIFLLLRQSYATVANSYRSLSYVWSRIFSDLIGWNSLHCELFALQQVKTATVERAWSLLTLWSFSVQEILLGYYFSWLTIQYNEIFVY